MSAQVKNSLKKSSWTPLSNEEQNNKLFEERRSLIGKWFEKWSDHQRKQIMEDLILSCRTKQLEYAAEILKTKVPVHRDDFTRELPRVITLYILSFLDPRSLCRASQVCWNWKHLSEADQIWMPKSIRLGWYLTFDPSPHEIGIWKRNYIENVKLLNFLAPKTSPVALQEELNKLSVKVAKEKKEKRKSTTPSPWRGSDKVPQDTWRNNYLPNDDEVEKVKKLRKKGFYGKEVDNIEKGAKYKINSGPASSTVVNANRPKHKTIPKVTYNTEELGTDGRPQWAKFQSGAPFVNMSELGESKTMDASDRPRPVHKVITGPLRSHRDPPSKSLFPVPQGQAWTRPAEDQDSDEN